MSTSDDRIRAYLGELVGGFWRYRDARFPTEDEAKMFESTAAGPRPPVFLPAYADRNVIVSPSLAPEQIASVRGMIPVVKRHRWFRSMRSSQALTQSVFANLIALERLGALAGLPADDGGPAFFDDDAGEWQGNLEETVGHLGEPSATTVDVFIRGQHRVAVECKLAELEVGACSRPRLPKAQPAYCDGSYTIQRDRNDRCSLTVAGVEYWTYVPALFAWPRERDQTPCPLARTYQLVRNVLAACVASDGSVDARAGHALLLYDARNPAFQPGGEGFASFDAAVRALHMSGGLRRCSWQRLLEWLSRQADLAPLTHAVAAKYGLLAVAKAGG